jgi:hypothetical protein
MPPRGLFGIGLRTAGIFLAVRLGRAADNASDVHRKTMPADSAEVFRPSAKVGNPHAMQSVREQFTSMQPKHSVDGVQFGRLDEFRMRYDNSKQRAFELCFPEHEEIL